MTACKTAAKTLSEEQTENGQNSDNIIPFDSRKFSGDIEDIFMRKTAIFWFMRINFNYMTLRQTP